jgi:short-subunit dehydrogenase
VKNGIVISASVLLLIVSEQRYPTAAIRLPRLMESGIRLVAVVTGASSGIGEATARRLAREPGARLVLVARREDRLQALAEELGGATVVAVDLTESDAPARIAEVVQREHGELHLLVNNAGAAWRGMFAQTGWSNIERHMKLNFEAPIRLTEALLPLLRQTAAAGGAPTAGKHAGASPRISIVNVASTAGRVSRPNSGAYSASKFALIGWSDALRAEERPHGVHVGLVLPGFVETEGFPARELRARALTRWIVSQPALVAEAVIQAGPGGKPERYVPRPYWLAAAARILAPALVRRATGGGAFTTETGGPKT